MRYPTGLVDTLQRRELVRVGAQLSSELGLSFTEARPGRQIDGVMRRAVQVGDGKFALVENSREFSLVPWRPVLENQVGKQVGGLVRDSGSISWTFGRSRGLSR